jgi:hypothetical protein
VDGWSEELRNVDRFFGRNTPKEEKMWDIYRICDMIYLTAVGLPPGGSSTVHMYTQTVHRTMQLIWEECGPCPVFASYTLAFALQLRGKKYGKTSVRCR